MLSWANAINDLRVLNQRVHEANNALSEHKQAMLAHCQVKVGDITTCNGYGHKEKEIQVSRIWVFHIWKDNYQFRAEGNIRKKDGSFGKRIGNWHGPTFSIKEQ